MSMSLCPHRQSEIEGREAHDQFNVFFFDFLDELAPFQWVGHVADELVMLLTHNIFYVHILLVWFVSLLSQSEIEGREAYHLFNVFLYFLDELPPFPWQ